MPACVADIVYSNSWLAQTSAIGSSTVYTVPSDGIYRVTFMAKVTGNPSTADITPHLGISGQDTAVTIAAASGGAYGGSQGLFLGHASDAVVFRVDIDGSPTYDVYAAVEAL